MALPAPLERAAVLFRRSQFVNGARQVGGNGHRVLPSQYRHSCFENNRPYLRFFQKLALRKIDKN
jgi:hypothetical protein